jgi:DNA polymerase III alpha subunit
MNTDIYGQIILDENDLCDLYMRDPERNLSSVLVNRSINIDEELELTNVPTFLEYVVGSETVEEFDKRLQSRWHMPSQYQELDIAKWVLDQCETEEELQRVGEELLLYVDRDLFPLLQYLKYLVDTMRANNIVWGIGRGSSVSSYVLYLIGVHKIDSIFYQLDINEFLR